ncbi:ricin B-like lectin [Schizophyllum commune Tattone D]|nr:ricin B-like lectin [Schizophyllum commune Tattone D]
MLSAVVLALLPAVLGKPLPRQTTTPTSTVYIHPNGNTDFCLGAAGSRNGALVDIFDCSTKSASTPAWTLDADRKRFQLNGTQMCLDAGVDINDGTSMKIWQCYDNLQQQQWSYNTADQHFSVASGSECLDLHDGHVVDGTYTQTWQCSGDNTNQNWTTSQSNVASTPPTTQGQVLHPNGNTEKCLEVYGNIANGSPIEIADCVGTDHQNWVLSRGSTAVKLAGTNFCLDAGEDIGNGATMKLWQCYEGLAQQTFYYTDDSRIAVEGKGQCLDLTGGILEDGNVMQTWACTDGNTNQIWS